MRTLEEWLDGSVAPAPEEREGAGRTDKGESAIGSYFGAGGFGVQAYSVDGVDACRALYVHTVHDVRTDRTTSFALAQAGRIYCSAD